MPIHSVSTTSGANTADLARRQVEDAAQIVLRDLPEDDPAIQVQHVGRAQDHAEAAEQREPEVDLERADQHQELADEARGARQADGGHGEQHEHQRVGRHPVGQAAVAGDLARVDAVVDHADAQEQRAGDDAVRQHLEQRALDALHVEGEDADRHHAHMRDRGIGDQLLHVRLRQRDQRGVDHRDDRQRVDQRRELREAIGSIGTEKRRKP